QPAPSRRFSTGTSRPYTNIGFARADGASYRTVAASLVARKSAAPATAVHAASVTANPRNGERRRARSACSTSVRDGGCFCGGLRKLLLVERFEVDRREMHRREARARRRIRDRFARVRE